MTKEWKQWVQQNTRRIAGAALAVALAGTAAAHGPRQKGGVDGTTANAHGKFYCNIKALTPAERTRLKELGEKMAVARTATVETPKGYEFQYSPAKISLGEVAEWAATESKCCSFYDFHIDLEEQGKVICLRLTGSQGIKAFIRSEFKLAAEGAGR